MKDLWPSIIVAFGLVAAALIIAWSNIHAAETPMRQVQQLIPGLFGK